MSVNFELKGMNAKFAKMLLLKNLESEYETSPKNFSLAGLAENNSSLTENGVKFFLSYVDGIARI